MRLAAILKKQVCVLGQSPKDPDVITAIEEMVEFKDQAAMEKWVKEQTLAQASSRSLFRLIKYEELRYEYEVNIKVKGL